MDKGKNLIILLILLTSAFSKAQNFNVVDFGAVSGAKAINTVAINKAILNCSNSGGGRVVIPAGEFLTGTIYLKSNVNLHLEQGAKLIGSLNINDYDLMPEGYYYSGKNYMGILFGNDIKNISITGNGIIDGRGTSFMIQNTRFAPSVEERKFTRQKEDYRDNKSLEDGPLKFQERPGHILTVSNAENVSIMGIEFIDSPKWTIRIGGSEHVKVSDITIKNNLLIPNSDGIHVTSSSYVNVSNSTVIAGDDALIVTGFISGNEKYSFGNNSKEAKNIIFDNCVVSSKSAGIRVGYGEKPIKNVIFSNIIINDSNRGIGIFSRDNSNISDIYFSNIMIDTRLHSDGWWGRSEPIHISAIPSSKKGNPGNIKNIVFKNINAKSESGILIFGHEEGKIENIKIDGLTLKMLEGKYTSKYGGNFDLRPAYSTSKSIFKNDIPALYAKGVNGLRINDIILGWQNPKSNFFTNGIEIENFENILITNYNVSAAFEKKSLYDIKLSKGENYKLVNDLSLSHKTKILYP